MPRTRSSISKGAAKRISVLIAIGALTLARS
jgi:hypothetical protein